MGWQQGRGVRRRDRGAGGGGWAAAGAAWAWEQGHGGGGAEGSRGEQREAEGSRGEDVFGASGSSSSCCRRQAWALGGTHILGCILDDGLHGVAGDDGHAVVQGLGGRGGCRAGGQEQQQGRSSSRSGGRVVERANARRRRGLMGEHRSSTAQHKASQNTACAAAALAGRHQHLRHRAP